MIEQIEHIKKFALQDNSALTVKQFGEAIARMCDDAIREAVEHSVQADVAKALSEKTFVAKFKKGKLVEERVISPRR